MAEQAHRSRHGQDILPKPRLPLLPILAGGKDVVQRCEDEVFADYRLMLLAAASSSRTRICTRVPSVTLKAKPSNSVGVRIVSTKGVSQSRDLVDVQAVAASACSDSSPYVSTESIVNAHTRYLTLHPRLHA